MTRPDSQQTLHRREEIRTVYFDVGGTILTARPSVGEIYADAARRLDYHVDARVVNENFRQAWKRSLKRRSDAGHVCDEPTQEKEWCRVVIETFDGLLPESVARRLFHDDLYTRFSTSEAWSLAPGALETFQELASRGLRLGILSNWDSRLEDTLAGLGILDHFDCRVISWQVGFEKPHARMFEEAIRQAGTPPESILHVGDSLDWDIRPAREHGLRTLWVNHGAFSEKARADSGPVVECFSKVLPLICRGDGRLIVGDEKT